MVYTKEDSQSLDFLRKSRVIDITIILIKILSYRNNYEAMGMFYLSKFSKYLILLNHL